MKFRALLPLLAAMALVPAAAGQAQQRDVQILTPGAGGETQSFNLPLNKSAIVNLPRDARDVLVANPDIVDAVIRTPRQAYLLGLNSGDTSIYFLDSAGRQILDLQIRVDRDTSGLRTMLERYVPEAAIGVDAVGDNIVLTGAAPSALAADRAIQIAQRWVDAPENVLSLLSVDGVEQVMLQVRVVEMQRTLLKQLGVNWSGGVNFGQFRAPILGNTDQFDPDGNIVFEALQPGGFANSFGFNTQNSFGVSGAQGGTATLGRSSIVGSDAVGGSVQRSNVGANISALERAGLVRMLAEPNLTAISGEAASFLAGGEFPVPSGRDQEGNVIIEFKRFGVGLAFTPVVLSGGRISLKVSTEVSDLSNQGALQLQGGVIRDQQGNVVGTIPGVSVPALSVRRAETTVELPSGGAIVIAGLIRDETRQSIDGLPGVKDLPVLGALFRSDDFLTQQTELVVIATPYLVNPTSPDNLVTPIDGLRVADGPESFLLGRMNSVYAAPGADAGGRSWQGPHGFVTDPGATP